MAAENNWDSEESDWDSEEISDTELDDNIKRCEEEIMNLTKEKARLLAIIAEDEDQLAQLEQENQHLLQESELLDQELMALKAVLLLIEEEEGAAPALESKL